MEFKWRHKILEERITQPLPNYILIIDLVRTDCNDIRLRWPRGDLTVSCSQWGSPVRAELAHIITENKD
jgi:hypothetical protein